MSTSCTIRSVEPRDIFAVVELLNALNIYEGYTNRTQTDVLHYALFVEHEDVFLEALVAEVDERIVGVLFFYTGYDTLSSCFGYHLADVIVADGHRRRGIGRALITSLAEQALQKNKQWISLTALQKNKEAQAFYASLGFVQVPVQFMAIGAQAMSQLINLK